ncbi:MAG: phosphatidylserine/phosphatidylglycerophosphate/cardiolipin synthase family protein [Gammaproteobacteria bacterium]|nr:phosphatidylserine/phosphatidylglycerophosphate/cardiolipin synthase family protein [Gammaproteobacteria bacterium]
MSNNKAVRWLPSGEMAFAAVHDAIANARENVQLETYILRDDATGRGIRDALSEAARRGVRVRVLIDAFGSMALGSDFWHPLQQTGGEYRVFNPLHARRIVYRNHRKCVTCDNAVAIIGGFNIADEYAGDGVTRGWRDLGVALEGAVVTQLVHAFESLYAMADLSPGRLARLRRATQRKRIQAPPGELLLGGPGTGANPLKAALMRDLARAKQIEISTAYFLPTWALRRRLMRCTRRGGKVRVLLPGPTDVPLARDAARGLYRRLLRAGVAVYEYQPQVLHAKLIIADDIVFVGSANFNTRSLHIDYELLLRIKDAAVAAEARALFDCDLHHAREITPKTWRLERSLWERLRQRFAYFVMARLDPLVARWLWRNRGDGVD